VQRRLSPRPRAVRGRYRVADLPDFQIDIRGAVAEQSNERADAPVARRLVYRGDAEVVSRVDVRAERQQEVLRVRSDVTYVGVELKGVFSRS